MNVLPQFKSLAHPNRFRISVLLHQHKELNGLQLIGMTNLPQAIVAQHLANLKAAGLVRKTRKGTLVFYRLTGERTGELIQTILHTMSKTERKELGLL